MNILLFIWQWNHINSGIGSLIEDFEREIFHLHRKDHL